MLPRASGFCRMAEGQETTAGDAGDCWGDCWWLMVINGSFNGGDWWLIVVDKSYSLLILTNNH